MKYICQIYFIYTFFLEVQTRYTSNVLFFWEVHIKYTWSILKVYWISTREMTANTTKFNPYWAGKALVLRGVKWQFTFTLTFFSLMVQKKHQLVVLSPAIVCVNLLLLLPYCFKLSLCLNCLIHLFWPFQSWHMQLLHLKNKPWSLKIGQPGLFYFNLPLQL